MLEVPPRNDLLCRVESKAGRRREARKGILKWPHRCPDHGIELGDLLDQYIMAVQIQSE